MKQKKIKNGVIAETKQEEPQLRAGKAVTDLIWSIGALALMNGTIQILIYPALNRRMGTDEYGDMLFLLGVATIFGAGIGSALNNGRLLRQLHEKAGNLDYLLSLLSYSIPAALIVGTVAWKYLAPVQSVFLALLTIFISLRYYSDVEYRLGLNYRGYFFYYMILSAGYLAGVMLWDFVPSWIFVMILGEGACLAFCIYGGHIYHPLRGNHRFKEIECCTIQLVGSYLLYNAVVQLDRVLLKMALDSSAVTIFYVASILGKVIALLVGPLNAILVSYLTRWGKKIPTKMVMVFTGGIVLCTGLVYLAVSIVTPFVVQWLYPDIYLQVMQYAGGANLGQILCFAGSLELTLLLTMAPARWQLIIQGGYAALFAAGGLLGVKVAGLSGFVWATVIAGAVRFIAAFVMIIFYSNVLNRARN